MKVYHYLLPDDRAGGTVVSDLTPLELTKWMRLNWGTGIITYTIDIDPKEAQRWQAEGGRVVLRRNL